MSRLAAVPLVLALVACSDNYSVTIVRNIAPSPMCVIDPGNDQSKARGFLDITNPLPNGFLNPGYTFTPEISNVTSAPTVTPTRPGNPNSHYFFLRGVEVTIVVSPDPASQSVVTALQAQSLAKRIVPLGISIAPNASQGLGFEVFDSLQINAVSGVVTGQPVQIVASMVAFGDIDGNDIESPPFRFPITLCQGCLIADLGTCSSIPKGTTINNGGTCNVVQDANLDCCETDAGNVICPAVAPTM
jgi:hypothetical protein